MESIAANTPPQSARELTPADAWKYITAYQARHEAYADASPVVNSTAERHRFRVQWARDRVAQEAAAQIPAHSKTPALDPAKRPRLSSVECLSHADSCSVMRDSRAARAWVETANLAAKYEAEDARKEAAAQAAQARIGAVKREMLEVAFPAPPKLYVSPAQADEARQFIASTTERRHSYLDAVSAAGHFVTGEPIPPSFFVRWVKERKALEAQGGTFNPRAGEWVSIAQYPVITPARMQQWLYGAVEHRDFCEGEWTPPMASPPTSEPKRAPLPREEAKPFDPFPNFSSSAGGAPKPAVKPPSGTAKPHWRNGLAESQKPNVHVTQASSLSAPRAWERRK
jgi:hypothetical protein